MAVSRGAALKLVGGTAVLALALAIACRGLITGTAVGIWDVEGAYAHEFTLLADFARSFELLLWNPLCNGGSPEYLRDTGNLSPLNILVAFVIGGELMSFWEYWLFFWLMGGVGILCLAYHFQAPAWGGVVVALGFLFSGFYTGHAQHTSYVISASFLPWIVWRVDVALLDRRWRPALEAGALWGTSALSGYPAFAIITGWFVALWALVRSCSTDPAAASASGPEQEDSQRGSEPLLLARLGRAIATCVIVLLVGLAILSPTFAGMMVEGAGYTDRSGGIAREVALQSNALHPGTLSTLASPYLTICKLDDQSLWPDCGTSMCSLYGGVLVPVLALLALLHRPKSSFYWGVLGCGLVCLAAALGEHLPVRGWLYDWFPPMRFFRHPAIFRLYWIFALCVLALCATRDMRAALAERRMGLKLLGVTLGLAVIALVTFQSVTVGSVAAGQPDAVVEDARWALILLWGGAAAICTIAAVRPGSLAGGLVPLLLVGLAFADGLHAVHFSSRIMFVTDPVGPQSWREIDAQHEPSLNWTARGLERVRSFPPGQRRRHLHNAGYESKTPTIYNYGPLANHLHEPLRKRAGATLAAHPPWIRQQVLLNSVLGPNRIWFARRVAEVPPTDDAFEAFSARSEALGAPPLVLHGREALLASGSANATATAEQLAAIRELPPAIRLSADVKEYTPRRLVLSVATPAEGWLWVTDRWARGWRAKVNGQDQEVLGGNFLFRAVKVPAGACEIGFEYEPFGFPWLLLLSWTVLLCVGAASSWSMIRRARAVSLSRGPVG